MRLDPTDRIGMLRHRLAALTSRSAGRLTGRDAAARAVAPGVPGVPEDDEAWANRSRDRDALAHEHRLNPLKQAEQINNARDQVSTLVASRDAIVAFVERERLLLGEL